MIIINSENYTNSEGLNITVKPNEFYINDLVYKRCNKTLVSIDSRFQKIQHFINEVDETERIVSGKASYSFWKINGVIPTSDQDLIDKMNEILQCAGNSEESLSDISENILAIKDLMLNQPQTSTPQLLLENGVYEKQDILDLLTANGWTETEKNKFHSITIEIYNGTSYLFEIAGTNLSNNSEYTNTQTFGGTSIYDLEEMDDFKLTINDLSEILVKPILF